MLFHVLCGMEYINAQNITHVSQAIRAKRQIQGKAVPVNQTEIGPHVQRYWQALCTITGAAISVLTEIISGTIQGAILGGPSGAILGAAKGLIQGLIGVGQSFAAGKAVNAGWQGVMDGYVTATWQTSLHAPWTEALRGDEDGLVWLYTQMSKLFEIGSNLRIDAFKFMYVNTYYDFGPWAGAWDSLLAPLSYFVLSFCVLFPTLFILPVVGARIAALVSLIIFVFLVELHFLVIFFLWLSKKLGWLDKVVLPHTDWGD
jgi:hypothetical protein